MRSAGTTPASPIRRRAGASRAASWPRACPREGGGRMDPGELYPRVGFIIINLARPAERVVAFYNQRGTAEQWIKEGKNAIKWTRLSCRTFAANAVRLQLRNEVCGPEPDRQRRAGPLHDRASRQRVIPLTFAAPENVRPVGEAVGFAGLAAPSADEPVAPADGFKVSGAIRVVTKEALELGERTRKWQIRMGQDDSGHDGISFSTAPSPSEPVMASCQTVIGVWFANA